MSRKSNGGVLSGSRVGPAPAPCERCAGDPLRRRARGYSPHRGGGELLPLMECPPEEVRDSVNYARLTRDGAEYNECLWLVAPDGELTDIDSYEGQDGGRLCACGADLEFWRLGPGDHSRSAFTASRLAHALARECALKGTSFRGASLEDATFVECDLRGADFRGALLKGCSFRACDMRGVRGIEEADEVGEAYFFHNNLDPEALVILRLLGSEVY